MEGLSRRNALKIAGAAIASSVSGGLNPSKNNMLSEEEENVGEFIEAFRDEISTWAQNSEIDYDSDNIIVGENHMVSPAFSYLPEVIEKQGSDVLGLEFIYEEDETVEEFNNRNLGPEEMAEHYNNVSGFRREKENLVDTFSKLLENDGVIEGLEFSPAGGYYADHEDYGAEASRLHVDPQYERDFFEVRSDKHTDLAEEIDEAYDKAVFHLGFSHVSKGMAVPHHLLISSQPKYAEKLSPEEVKQNPYRFQDFEDSEDPFGSRDYRIFTENPDYLVENVVTNPEPVKVTSREQLELGYLQPLLTTYGERIEESNYLRSQINKTRDVIESLENQESESGLGFRVAIQ